MSSTTDVRFSVTVAVLVVMIFSVNGYAQKKPASRPATSTPGQSVGKLSKLRDDYIKATKEYKASLQKLLALNQESVKQAEARRDQTKKLFAEGLISKRDVEQAESAVADAGLKVSAIQQQMGTADTQIAQTLVEIEGEKQMAKLGSVRRGSLVKTTSFIRYNGVRHWSLSQAGAIEVFFQQRFKQPLPIAVFGQGAIHNQWRIDHHNAMDISLDPYSEAGQALMDFLQSNGIPFSAFTTAIPNVATGPHIHVGMPSHRY